ncbi:uncharacterized protein LOC123296650 [Chrysoperla carnea]|uniref:uncharacterized protein LOC123296650 n=1 Tax=Chrysoperla carnea TaxID=189513 RepID=UPI001D06070C|nr:uncharacterized protein LOC123296650 [Chrysoperla carnea]
MEHFHVVVFVLLMFGISSSWPQNVYYENKIPLGSYGSGPHSDHKTIKHHFPVYEQFPPNSGVRSEVDLPVYAEYPKYSGNRNEEPIKGRSLTKHIFEHAKSVSMDDFLERVPFQGKNDVFATRAYHYIDEETKHVITGLHKLTQAERHKNIVLMVEECIHLLLAIAKNFPEIFHTLPTILAPIKVLASHVLRSRQTISKKPILKSNNPVAKNKHRVSKFSNLKPSNRGHKLKTMVF